MSNLGLPYRRQAVCVFTFFVLALILNAPLFAAGPAQAQNGSAITSGPRLWLQPNQPLAVQHVGVQLNSGQGMTLDSSALAGMGSAQPVSVTTDDLDVDGFQDLVVGYSAGSGGFISIHRGNIDAFAPQSDASFQAIVRGEFPSPFYLEAKTFSVPVHPDFVALGNFTGQGNKDLAVAAKGGNVLYIFPNDGKGNFGAPQTVNVGAGISALAAGQLGHTETLIAGGARSLTVYVNTPLGLTALASYAVSGPVSNILFGNFGDSGPDVAFLSGGKIQILRSATMQLAPVSLPVTVRAFALGGFIHDRNANLQIAVLASDGSIQIAVHNEFDPRTYTTDEIKAIRQATALRTQPNPLLPRQAFPANGWRIVESFPGVASLNAGQAPIFFRTQVSNHGADDVMMLNPFSGQLVVVSHPDLAPGASTFLPGQVSLRPYTGTPVAAVSMPVNVSSRPGVIAIHQNEIAPSAIFPIPDPNIFVNRTDDPVPNAQSGANTCTNTGPTDTSVSCSLREAILKSNGDTVVLQATTYTLTLAKSAGVFDGKQGTLEITKNTDIMGQVDGGGNPASIIQAGTTTTNGVDKILSINQDIGTSTTASSHLTNLVLQNGFNRGDCCTNQDGFGGAFDFDVNNSSATVTVTNSILQHNSVHDGQGGAITVFNTGGNASTTGLLTISNSTIQNNSATPNATGAAGDAGGIEIDAEAHMTLTTVNVLNNTANSNAGTAGTAGGIRIDGQSGLSARSLIHGGKVQGNTAAGDGGGILNEAALTIDTGTVISGNTTGGDGGGIWNNDSSPDTLILTKVSITGNTANTTCTGCDGSSPGHGGGIFTGNNTGGQPLSMSFSRLAGNTANATAPAGTNLYNDHTAITSAANNWWGTNNPSSTITNVNGGTTTFDPFIVLTHTSNPQKIKINQSAALNGDMSTDNHGNAVGLSNLTEIIGLPITFDSPVLGTIPDAQPETLDANAHAVAIFNAGGTAGLGSAHATVDQAVVPVNSNLIASASEASTTATITTVGAHGYSTGEFVSISGVTGAGTCAGYNGNFFPITGTTTTTFTYTAPSGLSTCGGGTANAGIIILQPPSITKTFGGTKIVKTNTANTITFGITNGNVVPINASFTDNLPTNVGTVHGNLVVATPPSVVNNCTGGTVTATAGSGSISYSNASSQQVGTCTIQVNVSSAVDNLYSNSVTIDSTDAGNGNTANDTLNVINPPTIAKNFGAAAIPLNGTTSLSIQVSNPNQNQTLSAITFTDTLPNTTGTLVVASPNNLTDNCTGGATAVVGSGSVSLASSSLAPGASCTVALNVQGTAAGVANNSVTASDTTAGTGGAGVASVTIIAPPSIAKAFNPTSIALNTTTSLQFTITNPAPNTSSLTGVGFTDTLPTGLTVASSTSTVCGGTLTTTAPTGISLSGVTIAASGQCQFSVTVTGATAGGYTNTTGAVTSNEGGTGNTATANLTVVAPPSIAKGFNPTTIALNATTSLTFTITNPGANTVAEAGVAFTDTLPTGLTVASSSSTVCGGTLTTTNPTGISLAGATIAAGGTCQFSVTVTGATAGQYTNTTGAVSSTNGGTGNTATANLTVASPPSIAKAFNPTTIARGATTSLQFTITNPNSGVTLTGVGFTDTLPTGLTVANNTSTVCGGTLTTTSPTGISLSGATIATSGQCQFSVTVTGVTAGQYTNTTGAVTSNEGGTGNTATANLTVIAPPSIAKAFNPTSIALNTTTSLQFTITNPAPNTSSLTGVGFTDTLPTGLTLASSTSTVCGGTLTTTAPTGISLSGATIAASGTCQFSVTVTGGTAGAYTNTTGNVSSTNGGTGNTATANLTVVAPPSIAKAFNPTTISLNATTSLTFTITNPVANTVSEAGVAFSDTLPTGLTVASSTSTVCGGTLTTTNPTGISLAGATIAAGGTCQFSVTVTGAASGQYTNTTGAVSSTNGGTGNTATANLTVATPPSIAKSFNPTTIPLNATTQLQFTITNPNSGLALTGVGFTDTLPTGLTVANGTSTVCGGTLTTTSPTGISLSGATIASSGQCQFNVTVTGAAAGNYTNTTGAVTSNEGGTGNTATASLTVSQANTTTTVASSVNPSVFGQAVTFTATVTDSSAGSTAQPTGSVQFVVDGVNFGTPVTLTGASSNSSTATSQAIATLSVVGSPHSVTANYVNADGNFINSTGALSGGQTVTIASTMTAVVSSANPSVFGQSITFTATVVDSSAGSTAQPTGSVQFVVDGGNFGTPVTLTGASSNSSTATSQATATLTIVGSPHSVTANYVNADGNFTNSTGSLAGGQTVNQAATTVTVTPSAGTITLGDTVTFTATVTANPPASGTPTGLVVFFDGGTPIGSGTLSAGKATFSTALLSAAGSPHSITAIYDGDANFSASPLSSPLSETVNLRGSTTGVALNPATVSAGQASTITATVTDAGASTPPGTPDTFAATGAPATGRTGFTSTLFADGLVLVAGGTDANNNVLKSAEIYSVSGGTFSSTGNLNTARTGAVAVLLPNGKVLVAGGSSDGTAGGALNTAELFDPIAGTFTPTSHNMTAARFGTTATVLNTGKVLIAGGANGGVLNSAELYDPAADTFTATGNLNHARTGASATLLGTGKVLVAGGSSNGAVGGALNSAEVFDPAGNGGAGTFASVAGVNPTLSAPRWQPEAALLLGGKVLIAGGQNSVGPGPVTSADLYDPAADSFAASAHEMNEARANGSAVALPSGMVLLAGGTTSQTVDLYDADSDKFNTTGSLLHHDAIVSTLLNNGQVLVVGLNSDNPAPFVSDAELYSPSFNPLGTVGFGSSDVTDVFGPACVLTPSTATASTCTSTVTPAHVGSGSRTITGTYPADAVHSGSSNSASLTVIPTAPPTISKAFSQQNVAQNSTVNVSFTIVNPNAAATLTGISFTDSLPAGLVVATPNNLNSSCGGTLTAVPGSSSISLSGGTVTPAASPCVITLDLLVTGTGTISNTTGPISANESGPGNPSNTATIQVVLPPTVNKVFGAASIALNGTTSLTFNIANPNTTVKLVGIALNDTLPSGLVVATPNGLAGSCTTVSPAPVISATAGGNSISLSLLDLNAAGSCSFSVNVKGTSAGTKNNTSSPITATFDDGSALFRVITGGTASASVVVVAPPMISKAFVPPSIAPGGVSALTFTITNPAVNTVAETGVAFTDTLPTNVVVATPNGLSGSCGGTVTATAGTGSISLSGGTVAAAGSCVFSVNVTSTVVGSYTNTTGAVTSTNGGTGNTASANLTVAHANLSITKTHSGNFPRGSTGNNYTITVSNNAAAGPTVGTVTVTDTLPNVPNTLVPTAMSGTGWTCTLNTLTCTRGDALAPGTSYPAITLTVSVPINIQANVTNSATVSGGGDPNSHTANDPTHIGPPIAVNISITNVTVNVGGTQFVNFTVDSSPGEGTVNFACSGLPFGATCNFNPPNTNQLSTSVTMGISTSAGSTTLWVPTNPNGLPPVYPAMVSLLGLTALVLGRKRGKAVRLRLALLVASVTVLLVLIGCGGTGNGAKGVPTPAGTYTITVTATSSATGDSGSATITLIVPQI